jgi:hypothetical protein
MSFPPGTRRVFSETRLSAVPIGTKKKGGTSVRVLHDRVGACAEDGHRGEAELAGHAHHVPVVHRGVRDDG